MYTNQPAPVFSINVTNTPLLITSINCFTAQDLLTGLASLQAYPPMERSVNVYIFANMSLASVRDMWPPQGFQLRVNVTFLSYSPFQVGGGRSHVAGGWAAARAARGGWYAHSMCGGAGRGPFWLRWLGALNLGMLVLHGC